jgi:hypothetical protein
VKCRPSDNRDASRRFSPENLKTFDFYLYGNSEAWHTLVHVCRKWRIVVLGSLRRLNVQLVCTYLHTRLGHPKSDVDNIIAALEHSDRVRGIILRRVPRLQMEKVLATMRGPFPEMTILEFLSESETAPVIPDSFLGGYAPRLRTLSLAHIPFPFPVLRKLHLSATSYQSLPFEYSSIWVHFTRGDGHVPFYVDQPSNTSPRIRNPSTSPCPGTATSTDTHSPPRSHLVGVRRGQRIFGGSRGPDRRSSILLENNVLQSTLIRHSTTRTVHQSHTNAQGTRWSTCVLFRLRRQCCTSLVTMDTSNRRSHTENFMQAIRLAASITGAAL